MNHYEHTQRTNCRTCHVVDDKSLALATIAPGHTQCVRVPQPETKYPEFTMAGASCVTAQPSRAEFFRMATRRDDQRARVCDSEGHAALEAKPRAPQLVVLPPRARVEHRTANGKPAVQCDACHYMVGDKTKWGGRRYQTLLDLHTENPIIDNSRDGEHKSCGATTACHRQTSPRAHDRELCPVPRGEVDVLMRSINLSTSADIAGVIGALLWSRVPPTSSRSSTTSRSTAPA